MNNHSNSNNASRQEITMAGILVVRTLPTEDSDYSFWSEPLALVGDGLYLYPDERRSGIFGRGLYSLDDQYRDGNWETLEAVMTGTAWEKIHPGFQGKKFYMKSSQYLGTQMKPPSFQEWCENPYAPPKKVRNYDASFCGPDKAVTITAATKFHVVFEGWRTGEPIILDVRYADPNDWVPLN